MKGIVITLNKLIIAVREIDSATSPLAKEVKIFEVTPPGAAAITITPKAISGGSEIILIKIKAIIGSKITWHKKPTKKSLGFFKTLVKSPIVKPRPKPNIIMARHTGAIVVTISIILLVPILL